MSTNKRKIIEGWKDINGYPLYQVSSLGRIKRKGRLLFCGHKGSKPHKLDERILKQSLSWGYKRVKLYKCKIPKSFSVHRLVAEHFILNTFDKLQVNHIDGNKLNNHIENLEWVTISENQKHAFVNGLNTSAIVNGFGTRFKRGRTPWNKRVIVNT